MARSVRRWRPWLVHFLSRALLLALVWWALTEGDGYGSLFGLAAVTGATLLSLALLPPPPWRLRWRGVPPFMALFLREMLLGGIDVAGRALRPSMPVSPGFYSFELRASDNVASRLLLALSAGLLPGTISVELREDVLELHVLDLNSPVEETLRALEKRIVRLFDES